MPTIAVKNRRRTQAERRELQRSNLFAALERLLAVEAFPEITIPRLLTEAQISRATFYLYFDNTAALLLETAETVFAGADDTIGPWLHHGPDLSRADLEATLANVFTLYREHKDVLRALVDASGYEPGVRAQMAAMHQRYVDALTNHIEKGQQARHIRSDAPSRTTAAWIIWMIERGLYQLVADAPADAVDEQVQALAGLIWNGLYRP